MVGLVTGICLSKSGPGYGGSCFPKDIKALLMLAQEHGTTSRIVEATIESNEAQKGRIIKKIKDIVGDISGKTIGILGLTFKADTDDIRGSPALTILPSLSENGAQIRVYDPMGMEETEKLYPDFIYDSNSYDVCLCADILIIITEWDEFRELDFKKIYMLMEGKKILDLRHIIERSKVETLGFEYFSI